MGIVYEQLGQLRPADTNPASLYSPAASTEVMILSILVCNTTGSAATFRLFIDDDGTTYDQTTALYYDVSVAANTTLQIDLKLTMDDSSGNLAVQTGTNNALTFTAFGARIT